MRYLIPAVLMFAIAGCASTLVNHYTLDMRPSAQAGDAGLRARYFLVADSLAGRNLSIKTGPTTMEYYATAQWVGSIDELLREKFQSEFSGANGEIGPDALLVDGNVLAFEQLDTGEGMAEAHARMEISVQAPGESRYAKPLLSRMYDARVPLESISAESLTEGLSRCVEQIAAQVRADVAAL